MTTAKARQVNLMDRPRAPSDGIPSFTATTLGDAMKGGKIAAPATKPIPSDLKYVIEDGIPIPPAGRRTVVDSMPFAQLKVGQSFFAEKTKPAAAAGYCKTAAKKYPGKVFAHRPEGGGVRFWRVEK